jgi:hypothetical protein
MIKIQLSTVINVSDLSGETENTCVVMGIYNTMPGGDRIE